MGVRDALHPAPGANMPNIILKKQETHLEVLGLDDPGEDEGADGEEGGEQEGEDHLDVRPRPEPEHAEQHQLGNLGRDIFI